MGKINILDKHIAELIAAGEVVERPSSVIKELVENAIDAGATAITVEIKNGGVTYMRVSDNGCGILREDIRPAFIRHATSKVRCEDDLDAIYTLGFRGEALASIASVSHVELLSRARGEDIGTRCLIEGGEEISVEDVGWPVGTTVIVRDLFYNVPARMKFLKTDLAEGNSVANVVDKIAMSHPEIMFKFVRDQKTVLTTSGHNKILSTIYEVYGREFASGMINVDYELGDISVKGYISSPEKARPNRNMQIFYINNRCVISKTAMAALNEACKGSVMVGKFPACVLFIEMSYRAVDVNVHPTKLEVRFVNERPVFDAVYHAVKTALQNNERIISALRAESPKNRIHPFELAKKRFRESSENDIADESDILMIEQSFVPKKSPEPEEEELFTSDESSPRDTAPGQLSDAAYTPYLKQQFIKEEKEKELLDNIPSIDEIRRMRVPGDEEYEAKIAKMSSDDEPETLIETDSDSYRFIGEAFMTYIIIEKNPRELILIDKHAAHERIIYERLKKEKGSGYSQLLLEPITVTLNKIDYNSVITNRDVFSEAGFEIDDFGEGSVIVRSAPQYLSFDDIEPSVIEMAGYLSENKKEIRSEKMDWIYHNVSCRAAVKGGNRSTEQELIALAKQVGDEDVRHCPHGRPVCITIKKREIERWFGRI